MLKTAIPITHGATWCNMVQHGDTYYSSSTIHVLLLLLLRPPYITLPYFDLFECVSFFPFSSFPVLLPPFQVTHRTSGSKRLGLQTPPWSGTVNSSWRVGPPPCATEASNRGFWSTSPTSILKRNKGNCYYRADPVPAPLARIEQAGGKSSDCWQAVNCGRSRWGRTGTMVQTTTGSQTLKRNRGGVPRCTLLMTRR